MKNKIILVLVAVLIVLGGYIALRMYNKPHVNVAESDPDLVLLSQTLLEDFESDEISANTKYLEQIIQVTGKIQKLGTANGNGTITLNNGDSMGSIICHLSGTENKKMVSLREGQEIMVKGICTGYLMDVILINCVLVN
ncbi:OB-fold putative lipoprotein [Allomuricauda sp. F6463D]|uniref:OB-fold putative lipoprotein n=1 Tax=Allomuricauda sp. F6463D TaxID=2926409 RepID=UPI001FF3C5A6|nr:OB-fold putative lipoprotein [Muricauda sp. F6463D]MCK0160518.1 OB-fold putative lipoprotein [Muricauda sp. F6463D]